MILGATYISNHNPNVMSKDFAPLDVQRPEPESNSKGGKSLEHQRDPDNQIAFAISSGTHD